MSDPRSTNVPSSSIDDNERANAASNLRPNSFEAFYVRAYCARRKARVHQGIAYPVDPEQLRILQSRTLSASPRDWRPYPSVISMSVAEDRLQNPLGQQSPDVLAALHRIREYTAEGRAIKWDLVVKMFDDFDIAYFQGMLRRRIFLQWTAFREDAAIFTADPSLANLGLTLAPNTPLNKQPRVQIHLRSDFRRDKVPRLYVLGCLLHEMLHAYFIVRCGVEGAREIGAGDAEHGPLFVRAARWLEDRSGMDLLSDWHDVAVGLGEESL